MRVPPEVIKCVLCTLSSSYFLKKISITSAPTLDGPIQIHRCVAGFRIRIFLGDPDPDPGKNLHADLDPGGIRGRGLGVEGKMIFFLSFFHVSDDS